MNRFDLSNPLKKLTRSIQNPLARLGGGSRGGRGYWGYVNHRDGSKSWEFIYGERRSVATPSSIVTAGNQISGSLMNADFNDSSLADGEDLPDDPVDGEDEEVFHYGVPTFHHEDGSLYVGGMDSEYSKKVHNPTSDIEDLYNKTYNYVLEKGVEGFTGGTIIDEMRSQDEALQYSPRNEHAPSTTSRLFIGEDGQTYIPHELQYLVVQMAKDEIINLIQEKHPKEYTLEGKAYSDIDAEQNQDRDDDHENRDDELVQEEPIESESELEETRGEDIDNDQRIANLLKENLTGNDIYSETLEKEQNRDKYVDPRRIEGSHWLNENNEESTLSILLKKIDDLHTEINNSSNPMEKKSITVKDFLTMLVDSKLNHDTSRSGADAVYGDKNEEGENNGVKKFSDIYPHLIQKAHNVAVTADMLGYQLITSNSIEMPDKIAGFTPGTDPVKKDSTGKSIIKGGGPLVYFFKGNGNIFSSDKKIASIMGDTIEGFTKREIEILEKIRSDPDGFSINNRFAVENKQTVFKFAETLDRLGIEWNQATMLHGPTSLFNSEKRTINGKRVISSENKLTAVDAPTVGDLFDLHIDPKIEAKKEEILTRAKSFSSSGFILAATIPTRTTKYSHQGGRDGVDPNQIVYDNQHSFSNPILFIPGKSHYGGGKPLEDYSNGTSKMERNDNETPFDFAERKMHAGLSKKIADLIEKTPAILIPLSEEGNREITDFEKFVNLVSPGDDPIQILKNYRRAGRQREDIPCPPGFDPAMWARVSYDEKQKITQEMWSRRRGNYNMPSQEGDLGDLDEIKIEKSQIVSDLATKCLQWAQANNTSVITPDHQLYPHALRSLGGDAPQILFVRHNGSDLSLLESLGKSPEEEGSVKLLAGVGTRNVGTTQSGKWKGDFTTDPGIIGNGQKFARNVTRHFAGKGWVIVSGLADGIDSICHSEAMKYHPEKKTIAILGGGIDAGHIERNLPVDPFTGNLQGIKSRQLMRLKLMRNILANGGLLISERLPGESSTGEYLTKRNRLQTGMSAGTIAFETPDVRPGTTVDTGTMRTAGSAVHQDRILATIDPSAWIGTSNLSPEKLAEAELLVSGNRRMIQEHGAHAIESMDPNHQSLLALEAMLEAKHSSIAQIISSANQSIVPYPQEDTRKISWERHSEERGIGRNGDNGLLSPFPPEILKAAFDYYHDTPQKPIEAGQSPITWKSILESPVMDSQKEKQKSNWLGKNVQLAMADAIVLFQTHLSSQNFGHIAKAIAQGKPLFVQDSDKSLGNTGTQALQEGRLPMRMMYVRGAAPKGKQNGPQSYWSWPHLRMMEDTTLIDSAVPVNTLINSISSPRAEISKASATHSSFETSLSTKKRMRLDPRIKSSTIVLGSRNSPIKIEIKKQIKKIDKQMIVYNELTMFRKTGKNKYIAVAKQRYFGKVDGMQRYKDAVKADRYADFVAMQHAAKMFASYVTRRQYFHSVLKQKSRSTQSPVKPSQFDETIVNGANNNTPYWGQWESYGPTIDPTQSILGNIRSPQVSNPHDPSWSGQMHDLKFEENKDLSEDIAQYVQQSINNEVVDVKSSNTAHIKSMDDFNGLNIGILRNFAGAQQKPRISLVPSTWILSPQSFAANSNKKNSLTVFDPKDLINVPKKITSDWFQGYERARLRLIQFSQMFTSGNQQNPRGITWLQNLAKANVSLYFVPFSPLLFRATPLPEISENKTAMLSKTLPSFVVSSNKSINDALFYPQIEKESQSNDATKFVNDEDWRKHLREGILSGISKTYLGPESSVLVEDKKPLKPETPQRPSTAVIIGTTTTGDVDKDERQMYLSMGYAVNIGMSKSIGNGHGSQEMRPLSEEVGLDKFIQDRNSQTYLDSVFSGENIKFSDDIATREKQIKAELFSRIYMNHVIQQISGKIIFPEVNQTQGLSQELQDTLDDIKTRIHTIGDVHMSSAFTASRFPGFSAGRKMTDDIEKEGSEGEIRVRNNTFYSPIEYARQKADRYKRTSSVTPDNFTVESIYSPEMEKSENPQYDVLDAVARNSHALIEPSWLIMRDIIPGINSFKNGTPQPFFEQVVKKIQYVRTPQGVKISIPGNSPSDLLKNAALVLYDKYLEEKSEYENWANNPQYNDIRNKILTTIFEEAQKDPNLKNKISPQNPNITVQDVADYLVDFNKSTRSDVISLIKNATQSTGINASDANRAMLWGVHLASKREGIEQLTPQRRAVQDSNDIYMLFPQLTAAMTGCFEIEKSRVGLGVFSSANDRQSKIDTVKTNLTFGDWVKKSLEKITNSTNRTPQQQQLAQLFKDVDNAMQFGFS